MTLDSDLPPSTEMTLGEVSVVGNETRRGQRAGGVPGYRRRIPIAVQRNESKCASWKTRPSPVYARDGKDVVLANGYRVEALFCSCSASQAWDAWGVWDLTTRPGESCRSGARVLLLRLSSGWHH